MSNVIKLKRGLNIKMSGMAKPEIGTVSRPDIFYVVPDHFAGITPRLDVKEGEQVKAGQSLFHDKRFTQMMFPAPVSGKVLAVNRGEKRKIMSISIEAERDVQYVHFDADIDKMNGEEIKQLILRAGLWSYIKQRPYDCIANPENQPKAVFVSAFSTAPLAPDYAFVLKDQVQDLQAGLTALSKMAGKEVNLNLQHGANNSLFHSLKNVVLTEFDGPHPVGNVGVQLNHLNPVNKGETVWTVNVQDVAVIGRLFTKGQVDLHRVVALTGPMCVEPKYYRVLPGTPLEKLFAGNAEKGVPVRYVAGDVLSGHQVEINEFVAPFDNQYTLIDDGSETHEFMGWIMPRLKTFSRNCSVPSAWLRCITKAEDYNYDARLLGGRRAIIVSGEYDKVFPMDIYPEYLIKAMIAGNIDKMEQLGAYEVAPEDFALPEYVCTSKMPLQAIVRKALDNMKQELE